MNNECVISIAYTKAIDLRFDFFFAPLVKSRGGYDNIDVILDDIILTCLHESFGKSNAHIKKSLVATEEEMLRAFFTLVVNPPSFNVTEIINCLRTKNIQDNYSIAMNVGNDYEVIISTLYKYHKIKLT